MTVDQNIYSSFVHLTEISILPLYKLPKQVWKNRLIPFWYVKIHKQVTAKEEEEEERRRMEEHQRRNGLYKVSIKTNDPERMVRVSIIIINNTVEVNLIICLTELELAPCNENLFYIEICFYIPYIYF